ncbi:hypothetical protein M3Y94_00469500 [Aphelenchoides besseyi]|nr:hypothetical protein M3Y94_00469500 [Aphelenchoides besseyi]KAI6219988.1 hypothetical protein M3Y95_01085800 [Aphelenchoides besseyi]
MLDKLILGVVLVFTVNFLRHLIAFLSDLQYKRRLVKDMPGPESRLFIGCVHKLPKKKSDFPAFFLEEAQKALAQGRSIMKLWFGPRLVIFPLNSESAKVILNSNVELSKGDSYTFLKRWLGRGLVTADVDHWHKGRKLLTPPFHFSKLEEYGHSMDYHCRRFIEYLNPKADGKTEINLYEPIKLASLDIIADAAMGVELNSLSNPHQPYCRAIERFADLSHLRVNSFYMNFAFIWSLLGYENETQRILKQLKEMTSWVVRERIQIRKQEKESEIEKKRLNFLDLLLELQSEGQLNIEEVCEQVDTFMFAGHDTTSHAINWTLWLLALHGDVQQKLYDEIVEHFGNSDADFHSPKVKELKLLNKVIKESLRIFPAVPMFERRTRNEVQIDGFTIPKGVSVKISPFLLHHNHTVWPDHWKFDPENFAEGKQYAPNAFVPFSAGPRNCIGQRFALREIQTMICHLIFNFQITTDRKIEDNGQQFSIVLRPTLGLPIKLRKRT